MSILLLLTDTSVGTPENPFIQVSPFDLQFSINEPSAIWRARMRSPTSMERMRLSIVRNEYIRFVEGFALDYSLGNRGILRCDVLDPREDPINAYRAREDEEITLALASNGTIIFTGRITSTEERALQEPNFGTVTSIAAVDYSEVAEHTFVEAEFGSEQKQILGVIAENPARVQTVEPHGFQNGDRVTIQDVVDTVPNVNGTYVVTVLNATEFTIPLAVTTPGAGGHARTRFYLREVLEWIFTNVLSESGVTLDPEIEEGPLLERIVFDGTTEDAFKTLSERTGWPYRFLPTKLFQMFPAGTKDAPFELDGDIVIAGFKKSKQRAGFANTVKVIYGTNTVVEKDDSFVGDGVTRVFPLSYKPAIRGGIQGPGHVFELPSGVARPVGVWGYDTLFEWVYRESDNTLVQLSEWAGQTGWPAPAAGFRFLLRYGVQFPQTEIVKDDASIAERGPWVRKVEVPNIFDKASAKQHGQTVLLEANTEPRRLTVPTREGLAFPGTTVTVTLPHREVSGDEWLITSVSIKELIDGSLHFTYEVLEDNQRRPGWIDYLKGLRSGNAGGGSSSTATASVIPPPSSPPITSIGSGTPGTLAVWATQTSLGDSPITQIAGGVNINGNLTINSQLLSPGDLVLNPTSKYVLPLNPYETNIGKMEKKWLELHVAELRSEILVAQETMAIMGGRALLGPATTQIVQDVAPGDTSIHVKHNSLTNGDVVYFEAVGKVEFMSILSAPTGSAGNYVYPVTRNLDGSGANQWYAGDGVFSTGRPGNGFMDMYSIRGIRSSLERGPSIVGNVRLSGVYNDWAPRWAIGNLNGIYGYTVDTYGVAFGVPPAAVSPGAWLTIDPTNGIRMGRGGTVRVSINALGNATFDGTITSNDGVIGGWNIIPGFIYSGATSTARVGMRSSDVSGDVAIWAGNFDQTLAPFRVYHDGQLVAGNAFITGSITVTGGNAAKTDMSNVTTIDGGKITTNTITASKLTVSALSAITANLGEVTAGSIVVGGSDKLWLNDDGDGRIAIGGTNKSTAPFRVTQTGFTEVMSIDINGMALFFQKPFILDGHTIQIDALAGGGVRTVQCDNNGSLFA